MAFATDLLRLRSHLPPAAWPAVLAWLQEHPVLVRVSTSRRTKLGDYRTADRTRPHRISVNEDLNPYAFLVVLVHEFAHYTTFSRYRRHEPHGREWKAEYRRLMQPYLSQAVFPGDVLAALDRHLTDAPSSSCTDPHLMRTMRRYDLAPQTFLEELEERTVFRFQRKLFVKGPQLRTRFRCKCLNDSRMYLITSTAEVQVEQAGPVRMAS